MSDGKRCSKCREIKPMDCFGPGKQWKDGLHPYCRPCKRASDRRSRARHASELSVKNKARYAADPEPAKARRKRQYYADPQRAIDQALAWNQANRAKHNEASRKWQQANLQGLVREAVRRRYATRKGAKALLFTPDQLAARCTYYGNRCWVCSGPFTEWDHVKPLSKGGMHCLSNLRPICRTCNARKSDLWPLR